MMSKPAGEQLSSTTVSEASTAITSSTVDTSASKVSLWFQYLPVYVCVCVLVPHLWLSNNVLSLFVLDWFYGIKG